jgi:23S rRNA (adenine2030-N6)-methyltransferase
MNYRHIYHAGNICDVVKHAILTLLLEHLAQKPAPFAVLDTHAGTGSYNLLDERAHKTAEADSGIRKLLHAEPLPELASYYKVIQGLNGGYIVNNYPGSPQIVANLLRPQDQLMACELHEEDFAALKFLFRHNKQVHPHCRDGYSAIKALLPPPEKRGLVLIDPPYEQPDEFGKILEALQTLRQRWPVAMAALWYPIKDRPLLWRFHEALSMTGMPKILVAEFIYEAEERSDRLNGSGMIIINPPWQLDEKLKIIFPKLHAALGTAHAGVKIDWLRD